MVTSTMTTMTSTPQRPTAAVGSALLTIAAIGGALCIVFVILAVVFHITLIMFKTGSMSPTIPTGSLAVVEQVAGGDIRVGDVVTVDRQDALPITHRVTSVTPLDGGAVSITMRGDANPTEDPAPYVVTSARKVLFSVPGLAYAVAAASNPIALGGITIGAASIVTWAFWPRETGPRTLPRQSRRKAPPARRAGKHTTSGLRHAATALAVIAAGASVIAVPAPAQAAVTEETIVGTSITLVSVADKDAMADLQPGAPVWWQVGITAHPTQPGVVDLALAASGGLVSDPRGLWVAVQTCGQRWVGTTCATGAASVVGFAAASAALAGSVPLARIPTTDQLWVLVEAVVPNAPTMRSGTASLSIIASGSGSTVVAGAAPGAVAYTGSDISGPLAAAVGALVVGLGLALLPRLRRLA